MPILIKKIDGSIISLFDGKNSDFVGEIIHIKSVIGELGLEDYILVSSLEGFVQDFSYVRDAEFCEETPVTFGPNGCASYKDLTLSY
jgi:hypothetical protein